MTKIAPSLLAADFGRIGQEIAAVEDAGADYLHVDVMDGRFVPALTWGPKIVGDLRPLSNLPIDCHLMICEPERQIDEFCEAGADLITFHLEATAHAQGLLAQIHDAGRKGGVAICPQTPVAMLDDLIEDCDLILVMSVNPGRGGQAFIRHTIEKLHQARTLIATRNPRCELEVDGGVGESNLRQVVAAGAGVVVMGTAIFGERNPKEALRRLRSML